MTDTGKIFEKLVYIAISKGIIVRFVPLLVSNGRLKGNRIAIRQDLTIEEINDSLAHELAHTYLHYDKGDTLHDDRHEEYEEQADRAARLLLDVLHIC